MPGQPPLPEIEAQAFQAASPSEALDYLRQQLKDDPRAGAKKLLSKFEKAAQKIQKEKNRLENLCRHEKEAWAKGCLRVAGVDEAGRGPLAGPVVAAAVILRQGDGLIEGVDDSKKLTSTKREELFGKIREKALGVGVGQASVAEIDELNIYRAARLAMERAIAALGEKPDYLLTDAMPLPALDPIPQKPLVHGDSLSLSIAAASIIAKVTRDKLMGELHQKFPVYNFESHKGYGTEDHLKALQNHGPCPEHRLSFGPVTEALAQRSPEGPFGYWKQRLSSSGNLAELNQVGLLIKRVGLAQLSQVQLEDLREIFRSKKNQWANAKA